MRKFRLLFADADPNVHAGHRRMIKALKPDWSVRGVQTAREAMTYIAELRPNIIVSELNLKLEDGSDLLKAVQQIYPEIIRIVLSSEPDGESEDVLRATQSAHRFLVKPCPGEALVAEIEQAANLRKFLKRSELLEIIGGIPYLPSLPDLYTELVNAIESPLVSLEEIGEIISRDMSMTTRILHLVNSAFFGLPRKVSRPQDAVIMLGLNVIKALVVYVKLFFAAPDNIYSGFSMDDLWTHSSLTARLSRDIAADFGVSAKTREDAFLSGMLHDIGKLILIEHGRYYRRVFALLDTEPELEFAEAEYKVFNTSHAEVGAYLLGLWGIPDPVVEAVACHHHPALLGDSPSDILVATHIANALLSTASGEETAVSQNILSRPLVRKKMPVWRQKAADFYAESRKK